MSVKETMRRLEESERTRLRFQRFQKDRQVDQVAGVAPGVKAKDKKYEADWNKARATQAALLEELRDTGVITLLEGITGPIKPINVPADDDNSSSEYSQNLEDLILENHNAVIRQFSGEWTAQSRGPKVRTDGTLDATLVLEVNRTWVESPTPKMLSVALEYGADKHLTIKGDETTFMGSVFPENLDQYKKALTTALLHPAVISV